MREQDDRFMSVMGEKLNGMRASAMKANRKLELEMRIKRLKERTGCYNLREQFSIEDAADLVTRNSVDLEIDIWLPYKECMKI